MSQTKPQNIPSSNKPITDSKTPMPKEDAQKAAPENGKNVKGKDHQASKHSTQK